MTYPPFRVSDALDWQGLKNLASAATVARATIAIAERIKGPRPKLRLKVKCTGGGAGLDFTAEVSEISTALPALDVHVFAELEGVDGPVYESAPFDLHAGELNYPVRFSLRRPEHGTLVPECNHHATLYGRELTVTAHSDNGGLDIETWSEELYDPETNLARYEIMQRVWREHEDASAGE